MAECHDCITSSLESQNQIIINFPHVEVVSDLHNIDLTMIYNLMVRYLWSQLPHLTYWGLCDAHPSYNILSYNKFSNSMSHQTDIPAKTLERRNFCTEHEHLLLKI